jgi:hypothetical protein
MYSRRATAAVPKKKKMGLENKMSRVGFTRVGSTRTHYSTQIRKKKKKKKEERKEKERECGWVRRLFGE